MGEDDALDPKMLSLLGALQDNEDFVEELRKVMIWPAIDPQETAPAPVASPLAAAQARAEAAEARSAQLEVVVRELVDVVGELQRELDCRDAA